MKKSTDSYQKQELSSVLQIDHGSFIKKLEGRIKIGESLLINNIRTKDELNKLQQEYYIWDDFNSELLKQSFDNPENEYKRKYDDINKQYAYFDLNLSEEIADFLGDIESKTNELKRLKEKAPLIKIANTNSKLNSIMKVDTNKVFIVHGHDEAAQSKTARFIEKVGLEAIILHEQVSSSSTIIEKIEQYSNVGFAIILYTPCDVGGKKDSNLKPRARQNVVFEHGYLMGKIGRKKVCAVVHGDVETPNDISGVIYVPMDSNNAWQYNIAKEMNKVGYEIDLNKI